MTSPARRVTSYFTPFLLAVAAALWISARSTAGEPSVRAAKRPIAKNVIVLIVDGCSSEQYTLARWHKGEPLALDAIRVGAVKTHSADSVITDSAAAASAFATGVRTDGHVLSLTPKTTVGGASAPSRALHPMATVLEGARLLGKATGIVATSSVTHATPAAYMAHAPSRGDLDDIMEQAVYQNVDVVLGGGASSLLPEQQGGLRRDRENLAEVLHARGYQLPRTRDALRRIEAGKVFGTFADEHMAADCDRPEVAPQEPSLLEMTEKAVELLAGDPDGFFLMVEASQVDWACHANDPAHLLSDLAMYDRVVTRALDFAKRDGQTLVLALSDHNTGGMSIGNRATDKSYRHTSVEDLIGPLRNMKRSAKTLWAKLEGDLTIGKVKTVVAEYWGLKISDADAADVLEVADGYGEGAKHSAFGEVLCAKYTCLGWTTHGHAGGDVPLHAFGPGRPVGVVDGPDVAQITAAAFGLDLERLNRRLYQEATEALPDANVTIEQPTPHNFVIQVERKGRTARLPANKNLLQLDDRTIELEGVVVCVRDGQTRKAYLPMQAVKLITGVSESLPAVAPRAATEALVPAR